MSTRTVASRVKELREQHLGLTQVELAFQLRSRHGKPIDPMNISKWERGVADPSLWYLRQLAGIAELPVHWFFEERAAA